MMIGEHYLWWLLTMACVVWYCTITVYVAIRGTADIKAMLTRLRDQGGPDPGKPGDPSRE